MFQRTVIQGLRQWTDRENRKPLVLRGARQVGKTSLVELFAKEFDHFIKLNLDQESDKKLFEKGMDVHKLFDAICLNKKVDVIKGKLLLFIDEIQNSPEAVAILRYFYEEKKEIYVIAAGSLLESLTVKKISFPVGRVEYLSVRPVSFIEFLMANNDKRSTALLDEIPFPEYGHEHLLSEFRKYSFIGGMPEVVDTYIKKQSFVGLNNIFDGLITSFLDDVEKYAPNQTMTYVIRFIIQHSFNEAARRIKFQGFANSTFKNREMSVAFRILEKAFLLQLIYPVVSAQMPLEVNFRRSPKLQLVDTGMVNYFAGLQSELISSADLSDSYQGRIAEHITAQELMCLSQSVLFKLNFWSRDNKDSSAEVDFVWQHENMLIPIEVKSGVSGKLRSLQQFIDRSPHSYAVRVYSGKFSIEQARTIAGKEYWLMNLPFYLVNKLPEYLGYFVKKYK
ncbi:MAG: AAA family ATPase [Bacteroidales bacterium]|nr:AAA family ATPase [Bacteroidales bacterium]MCF8458838.1 AAA family ATPase [Bacteroidales bacterium]